MLKKIDLKSLILFLASQAAAILVSFAIELTVGDKISLLFLPLFWFGIYVFLLKNYKEKHMFPYVASSLAGYMCWFVVFGLSRIVDGKTHPVCWEVGLPMFLYLIFYIGMILPSPTYRNK